MKVAPKCMFFSTVVKVGASVKVGAITVCTCVWYLVFGVVQSCAKWSGLRRNIWPSQMLRFNRVELHCLWIFYLEILLSKTVKVCAEKVKPCAKAFTLCGAIFDFLWVKGCASSTVLPCMTWSKFPWDELAPHLRYSHNCWAQALTLVKVCASNSAVSSLSNALEKSIYLYYIHNII